MFHAKKIFTQILKEIYQKNLSFYITGLYIGIRKSSDQFEFFYWIFETWEFWSSIWPNEAKKVKKDRDKVKKDREKKRKEAKRKYIQKREELARKKPKKESRPSDVIPDEAESMDLESPDLQYGIVDKSFEEEKKEDDDQEEDLSDKIENLWDIGNYQNIIKNPADFLHRKLGASIMALG